MKIEITDYYSADIDNVWDWHPASPSEVFYNLEIEVSEHKKKGGILFQLNIATPEGLHYFTNKYGEKLDSKNILLFDDYSWDAVMEKLGTILKECTYDTWNDCLLCLRKHFTWEYENHKIHDTK